MPSTRLTGKPYSTASSRFHMEACQKVACKIRSPWQQGKMVSFPVRVKQVTCSREGVTCLIENQSLRNTERKTVNCLALQLYIECDWPGIAQRSDFNLLSSAFTPNDRVLSSRLQSRWYKSQQSYSAKHLHELRNQPLDLQPPETLTN